MKVLVTGGQGFIGRWVCEALYFKGHDPLIFDRHDHGITFGDFFLGDIRDAVAVTEAMAHADAWIHLAGVLGTAETIFNPRPAAETNILGGLNVLEAATQYDLPGVNIAVGNYWMNNTYAITKNSVSRFAEMFRDERGLQVTNVRALNAYGPGQSVAAPYGSSKVRKIMPSFICRALSGDPIEIYGDGEQIMDMIYVKDVASILLGALEYTAQNGAAKATIDAGTGRETTVNDIAKAVAMAVTAETGRQTEIKWLPMRNGEPEQSIVLGNSRTMAAYGIFDPDGLVSLEDGLQRTIPYFENYLRNYNAESNS